MSQIPKHEANRGTKGVKKTRLTLAGMPHIAESPDSGPFVDMSGIEAELATLARYVREYVGNASIGEHSLNLFTAEHSYPLRLVLEGDAVDSIADSLKRIADAMTARAMPVSSER